MDRIRVERIGGIAGFGLPNSRLKSFGFVGIDELGKKDRVLVEALFKDQNRQAAPKGADMFRYRISRETTDGTEVVEVPESIVPPILIGCVHDEIE